jgi:hypothetical protein
VSSLSDDLAGMDIRDAERHLQSILQDLVTDESGSEIQWGDQSSAIGQLAELLAGQQQRIAALEAQIAALLTAAESHREQP